MPDHLHALRTELERLIPHGMTKRGRDKGSWETPPEMVIRLFLADLVADFELICAKHLASKTPNNRKQLGTLGTGNHFGKSV